MPALIAAPWLGTAIAGIAGAGASVVGAKMMGNATDNAAAAQQKGVDASLAFQNQQAAIQQRNFEATQHANYGQWAADTKNQFSQSQAAGHNGYNQYKSRDQRVGRLGELLGMAPRETTPYEDPTLTIPPYEGPNSNPVMSGPQASGPNPRDPNYITKQLQGVYKSLGVTPTGPGSGPTDIEYMTKAVGSKGGWTPDNAKYWPTRIAQEIAQAKAKGSYQGSAGQLLGAH